MANFINYFKDAVRDYKGNFEDRLKTIKFCLSQGVNINYPGICSLNIQTNVENDDYMTALDFTIGRPDVKMTEILLKLGADVHISSINRGTLLTKAVLHGHTSVIILLAQNGILTEKNDIYHKDLLHEAMKRRYLGTVESLLQIGFDPNKPHSRDKTFPMEIAIKYLNPAYVKMLIEYGADVDIICSEGINIYLLASKSNYSRENCEILRNVGASIE